MERLKSGVKFFLSVLQNGDWRQRGALQNKWVTVEKAAGQASGKGEIP